MMTKGQLLVFAVATLVHVSLTVAHVVAATEYLRVRQRGSFESLAIVLGTLALWPLFSLGMMLRGYDDFWDKTWPKEKPAVPKR